MNCRNLIPARHLLRIALKARLRGWGLAIGIEALLLGGFAVAAWCSGPETAVQRGMIESARAEDVRQTQLAASAKAALAAARQQYTISQQFVEQPDWSRLLQRLSEIVGSEAMLTQCEISPAVEQSRMVPSGLQKQAAPKSEGYVVRIAGLAVSQNAVSHIVVRCEDLNIFDQVTLLQTSPQILPGSGQSGVLFQVACKIAAAQQEVRQ